MTPGESFGLGYICGQASIGTPSNPKLPDILRSCELRMQFRKGWSEGYRDAKKGVRNCGRSPKFVKAKKIKLPVKAGKFVAAPTKARLMAGR